MINLFYNLMLVALGGAGGSMLRYVCQRSLNLRFPYGTMVVNLTGCFLIGLLIGYLAKEQDEKKQLLLVTGFCGGFTTFSSFTLEGVKMMQDNRWVAFFFYTSVSVIVGLIATIAGLKLVNY